MLRRDEIDLAAFFPTLVFSSQYCLSCTSANGQGVHISFTFCLVFVIVCVCVCVCVYMVEDFSAEDKAIGFKFCTVVHRRPGQGISHFGELYFPRSPKLDEWANAQDTLASGKWQYIATVRT